MWYRIKSQFAWGLLLAVVSPTLTYAKKRILNINSNPSGARVEIDGNYVGVTPLSVDPHCGGSCFNWVTWASTKHLTQPVNATISKPGCIPQTISLTQGPYTFTNLLGEDLYQFYLYASDDFAIALVCPHPEANPQNSFRFDNRSGVDAVVLLMGAVWQAVGIMPGEEFQMNVPSGTYSILVRFGTQGKYTYSRAGPLTLQQTVEEHSAVKVALQQPAKDDWSARIQFDELRLCTPDVSSVCDVSENLSTLPELVFERQIPTDSLVTAVAFGKDARTLASGNGDKMLKLWDLSNVTITKIFTSPHVKSFRIAFSPDGQWLASTSADKAKIRLWNVVSGQERELLAKTKDVTAIAFSPDGRWLASAGAEKAVVLWDLSSGTQALTFPGHSDVIVSLSFSPDSHLLASGSFDHSIKIWDLSTGGERCTLEGHSDSVAVVAFSPDGHLLASGGVDHSLNLWNVAERKILYKLSGHSDTVISVAFSPDGKWLASAGEDRRIKLWETATGRDIQTLMDHNDSVNSVSFSPDGKWLASASSDKTIRLWRMQTSWRLPLLTQQTHDLIRRGEKLIKENDLSEARDVFDQALLTNTRSSLVHYRIAEVLYLQHNPQDSLDEYLKSLNGDGIPHWTLVWSHLQLGKILDLKGQRERALTEYQRAIQTNDNTDGALVKASTYMLQPFSGREQ